MRFYPPYPLFIRKGKGSKIWDVDDNEYLDFLLAYGPLILGHSPDKVVRKVEETIQNGTLFGAPTEQEVRLGELLTNTAKLDKVRLVNSGTEATMHAVRLAIHHTGRKKILKVIGGYHGTHPFNFDSELVESIDFNSQDKAREKLKSKEFACFIVEPVMGNTGVVPPEPGFLETVREITEDTGTLMIFDEVITGYRTGFYPYYVLKKLEPDLATFGKIIGGGFPLAAFGGREDIMREVRPSGSFPQAGTFSGNPVSVTAGLETLKILSTKDYSHLKRLTDIAVGRLSESGLTVNSQTGMLSLFFSEESVVKASDAKKSRKDLYFHLFKSALEAGIYLAPSYDETIFISFEHTERDVKDAFEFLGEEAKRLWKGR
ncbi:MAG: aminotransferase class III-fold pyridoxal phosphate-dependent enzyme [Thermoplasmatales archaeon]